jgi:uncharacterized protein (DUF4415 family)/uncharacterized DUF497 family protein
MVRFEWDELKAKSNARKHGVRFEDAMLVFADPYALVEQDRLEGGELRWQTLGLAGTSCCSWLPTSFGSKRAKSFALFQLEKQYGRSANAMTKIVKKSLSDNRLTAARKHRLEKLSRRTDEEINTSDIPELTEKFWRTAIQNPFYRPLKRQLTLRLDADIIAWLRLQGRGYQTRANAMLRDAMLANLNLKKKKGRGRPHRKNQRQGRIAQRAS